MISQSIGKRASRQKRSHVRKSVRCETTRSASGTFSERSRCFTGHCAPFFNAKRLLWEPSTKDLEMLYFRTFRRCNNVPVRPF